MKAMILAAGRGRRLRPLTDSTPKCLLMINEFALIEHQILALSHAGVSSIIINLSYKPKMILEKLGRGDRYGVELIYSYEGEQPLDTGGAISHALNLLGEQPFIVTSADIYTDYDYSQLRLPKNALAHLVMRENPEFHPQGDFAIGSNGFLQLSGKKFTYANIGVFHRDLFIGINKKKFGLGEILNLAIQKKRITGALFSGKWFNVSTQKDLEKLRASV